MVRMICESELFDEIYLTTFNSYRTTDADSICKLFREMIDNNAEYGKKIKTVKSIPILSECLDTVLSGLLDNEMLFTAGSLYLAPSCGMRFSEIFIFDMILIREMIAPCRRFGGESNLRSAPSMR